MKPQSQLDESCAMRLIGLWVLKEQFLQQLGVTWNQEQGPDYAFSISVLGRLVGLDLLLQHQQRDRGGNLFSPACGIDACTILSFSLSCSLTPLLLLLLFGDCQLAGG